MHIIADGNYKKIKRKIKDKLKDYKINHTTIEFDEMKEKYNEVICEIKSHYH